MAKRRWAKTYDRLIANPRKGSLAAGEFASIPELVELLDPPLAATHGAVKQAEANGLLRVVPKRGVLVMDASPKVTRDYVDLHMLPTQRALTPELPRRAVLIDLSLHAALSAGLGNPLAATAYQGNRDRIAVAQNGRPFLPDRIVPAMHEHLMRRRRTVRGPVRGHTGPSGPTSAAAHPADARSRGP